ncbi:MAG: low molecular weight protein-tyrosine-phosphatase [Faecousia sp.]
MIKVLFVCHGNICRSPMAEFLFRRMVEQAGLSRQIQAASAATSTEEIGNPVYPPARRLLAKHGISTEGKTAVQLRRQDYDRYDWIVAMDAENLWGIRRILGSDPAHKVFRLLELSDRPRDIADPWYTGDFQQTYDDLMEGCALLLDKVRRDL